MTKFLETISIQIGYHLQSYTDPATAPFQGAIMESGGPTARATLSPAHPRTESQWREFLLEAGVDASSTSTSSSSERTFALLRALPLEVILRASNAVFARYQDPIRWPFQPVIESDDTNGRLIRDLPIASFRRGHYLPIPVLTGFNTNEGTVFCSPRVDTNDDFLGKFTTMIPGLGKADLAALAEVYPDPVTAPPASVPYYGDVPPGFGRQWARYEAAYAHYAYICPVLQTGHFYSHGNSIHKDNNTRTSDNNTSGDKAPPPPIWIYHFAALSRPDFGGTANHVDEAVVVAHDMGALAPFPGLVATSDVMHGAFVRFIATGDPNPKTDLATPTTQEEWWPRFQSPLSEGYDLASSPGRLSPSSSSSPSSSPSTTTVTGRKSSSDDGGDDRGQRQRGQVMMFGADNDERMGGADPNPGTPARVVALTAHEVAQCRFWWERVELSEGMGRRVRARL